MTPEFEDYPLQYAQDAAVFMHRDVHFGGSFDEMLEYYLKEGKGVHPDFELSRVIALAKFEKQAEQNLAPMILTGADSEKIARAKQAYQDLRDLYELPSAANRFPILIADLILSEDLIPQKEIDAIIAQKGLIVPSLLELLHSESFYDPLFPGYGQGPMLAAKCLGLIGDKRAIISLFEAIGEEDFFNEDVLLQALKEVGTPAKEFLLHVLKARPINYDNERAAIALLPFSDDPEVAKNCFKMLQEPEARKHVPFANYLALVCEGLADEELRRQFIALANDPATPKAVILDIKTIAGHWK